MMQGLGIKDVELDTGPIAMHGEVFDDDGHVRVKARHYKHKKPDNCWNRFTHLMRKIWETKFTEDIEPEEREKLIRTTLRELIIYMLFLTVLCIVIFGMQSHQMYMMSHQIKNVFLDAPTTKHYGKTFLEFSQMDEFWHYAEGPLLDGLYQEHHYWGPTDDPEIDKRVLLENKLLGLPRLRMIKVRNDSCQPPDAFFREIKECFAGFADIYEDSRPFGPRNDTAWVHHTDMHDAISFWGSVATYPNNGFYEVLSSRRNESELQIAKLKKDRWIDRGTRVVFIDFTLYNANANLFCIVKLVLEFPPTGGVLPMYDIKTVKLLRYENAGDYFILVLEAIFFLFVIYYIVEEIIEIRKWRCSYFNSFWNTLDIIVLTIACGLVAFTVYRTINVTRKVQDQLGNPDQYASFEFIAYAQELYNQAAAIMVFCSWVKIFKYVSFNKTMNQLSSTLSRCAKDVGGFAIMFFIFFFAYAQLGYLLFGTQVRDFASFYDAIFALLRTMLGDFEFHQLEEASRYIGPIFFISYVFFVFFVLLNMFLAIINDTYAEVKSELKEQKDELEMGDYFKGGYYNFLRKWKLKKGVAKEINDVLHVDGDAGYRTMEYDEWKNKMLEKGYRLQEIQAIFERYDTNEDRELDEQEQQMMELELAGHKVGKWTNMYGFEDDTDSEDEDRDFRMLNSDITVYEFNVLHRRIDRAEMSLSSVAGRIDAAVLKLEQLDRIKMHHREKMQEKMAELAEMHGDKDDGSDKVSMGGSLSGLEPGQP